MVSMRRLQFLFAVTFLLFFQPQGTARQQPFEFSKLFDKTEVMIPARDGTKLHTVIYTPKNAGEPLPIILERTPYRLNDDEKGYSRKLGPYEEMVLDGYFFVFQHIR